MSSWAAGGAAAGIGGEPLSWTVSAGLMLLRSVAVSPRAERAGAVKDTAVL